uniref:Uncharacterized protein n=1 Tax=Magallana gigas TaxID=29159 RepID=A0A8W8MI61_MAGGI
MQTFTEAKRMVGEQLISNFSKRRQCTLQCGGRTALLTLWGQKSEDDIIPGLYEVYAVRPTNDFNGQRSYNSTPSTAFKRENCRGTGRQCPQISSDADKRRIWLQRAMLLRKDFMHLLEELAPSTTNAPAVLFCHEPGVEDNQLPESEDNQDSF